MKKILITGANGFLGSHISLELIHQGYEVVALKRSTSNLWRCKSFINQIKWIDCDNLKDAELEIIKYKPNIFIHAAWNGVKAADRDDWVRQEANLYFLVLLLEIIKKTTVSKIIALGSQAEYGNFEGSVSEDFPCNPNTAYGTFKYCSSKVLKSFSEQNEIEWYWIRIFAIYGPKGDRDWLIPATINNLLKRNKMSLTGCEQQYDYLYTKDFSTGILNVVKNTNKISGIYNMSSGQSTKIKDILTFIENKIFPNQKLLQFGELPYRPNQLMYMEGNSDRFFQSFKFWPKYTIYEGLEETIKYYKITMKE